MQSSALPETKKEKNAALVVNNASRRFPVVLLVGIALLLTVIVALLHWPTRPVQQFANSNPGVSGNLNFSGVENHPEGYKFAWALKDSILLYPDTPRYAPLFLTLRASLDRPPDAPPAIIEIYERPARPTELGAKVDDPALDKKVGELRFDPEKPGVQDYQITIPPRANGDGVYLTFKTNTFQPKGDRRELAFMFVQATLNLKPSHLRYLVWPYPFLPGVFLLLLAALAWGWYVGLGWLLNMALSAQMAYTLMLAAQSTWRISWLLPLIALGLIGLLVWSYRKRHLEKPGWAGIWPILVACGLVIAFFLTTNDELGSDIIFYVKWSGIAHDWGVWNIYQAPIEKSFEYNYLPLMMYLTWLLNLVAYPLGWTSSYLFWRIFFSALYLVLLVVLYLILVTKNKTGNAADIVGTETETKAKPNGYSIPATLLLVGFNVSIFYNPTIWGQSDIIAMLPLALCFLLIYREKVWWAGLLVGITLISKPQAWFILPIVGLLMLKTFGWRRTLLALGAGGLAIIPPTLVSFGFNWSEVVRYVTQGQFAGELVYRAPQAYNLSYLVLDYNDEFPAWLSLLGFGLTGLIYLLVLARNFFETANKPGNIPGGAGILNTACYTLLIKMKERYLVYAMPLLGISAHYTRRFVGPFMVLCWLQLINLSSINFLMERSRLQTMPEVFYLWSAILSETAIRKATAVGFLLTLGWLLWLYLSPVFFNFSRLKKSNLPTPPAQVE